ncbi:hypothetical protein MNBD_GAMMA22-1756 [hydrothermal vent metagenome]|uniref:Outer membrane efflux protein n=1 Tax=hydrothermal vent metagenome TaxID=652676 RepID=A0A3B0ZXP5_9ZZZZ
MTYTSFTVFKFVLLLFILLSGANIVSTVYAANGTTETFESFIQKVLDNHESLQITKRNITKTKSDIDAIRSKLGWNLSASSGLNRSRSFIGAISTQTNLALGINKIFQSGDSIELKSSYSIDDSEFVIINSQANPISSTRVDINYRMHLLQNKNYSQYLLDETSVDLNYSESRNIQLITRDEITIQAIELFYGAAILMARLETAKQSITRAKKLKSYIQKNIELGILEKGEILQSSAQLYNLQGQYQELKLVWEQSEIAINRLIGNSWDINFEPRVHFTKNKEYKFKEVSLNVKKYNPALKILNLNLKLVESIIAVDTDNTRSKLDLVISLGSLNTQGPSAIGSINDNDIIGGVKLEYNQALDERGINNKLYQSQLDKLNVETQILKLEKDLNYDSYSLITNIKRATKINNNYLARHKQEIKKYNDIVKRYRSGRADTNIVIQFENERTQAELVYNTQTILREKTIALLKLKQGKLITNQVSK